MIKKLIKITKQKLILPFYHTVSNEPLPHIKHLYKIRNIKQFEKDLEFLLKYYKPIDLQELKNCVLNNKTIKKNSFFLSFDDGLREGAEIIAPILFKKGIPATFFVNSDFIDNKNLFYKFKISLIIDKLIKIKKQKDNNQLEIEMQLNKIKNILKENKMLSNNIFKDITSISYSDSNILNQIAQILNLYFKDFLKKQKPYLTSSQINKLISDGFTIGSHSINHPNYQNLPIKEQIRQTKESIDFITKKFKLDYKIFAFPFTDFRVEKRFFETIINNKFAQLTFGTAGLKKDNIKYNLQRIPIENTNKPASYTIKKQYLYYIAKFFVNKNTIIRK